MSRATLGERILAVHQRLQRVEQAAAVIVDRPHAGSLEQRRKGLLHQLAVLQHVRHARRASQIVLEHVKAAVAIADQVGARDVAPDALGRIEADALPAKGGRRLDHVLGNDTVLDDLLLVVNVVDKQVEGGDPLGQPPFELDPTPPCRSTRGTMSNGMIRSVPSPSP